MLNNLEIQNLPLVARFTRREMIDLVFLFTYKFGTEFFGFTQPQQDNAGPRKEGTLAGGHIMTKLLFYSST